MVSPTGRCSRGPATSSWAAAACARRPAERIAEAGVHILPAFWRQGFAVEALRAVIEHAFGSLDLPAVFAGHHPANLASRRLLEKLRFEPAGEELYAPTGLLHPSYLLRRDPGRSTSS